MEIVAKNLFIIGKVVENDKLEGVKVGQIVKSGDATYAQGETIVFFGDDARWARMSNGDMQEYFVIQSGDVVAKITSA